MPFLCSLLRVEEEESIALMFPLEIRGKSMGDYHIVVVNSGSTSSISTGSSTSRASAATSLVWSCLRQREPYKNDGRSYYIIKFYFIVVGHISVMGGGSSHGVAVLITALVSVSPRILLPIPKRLRNSNQAR